MRTILVAAALLALAACGEETDDREPTAQYLVPAIFRPACGTAACHSSATGREGLVLDTIEGVCLAGSLDQKGPLTQFMTDDAENRMPLDAPLPEADVALLNRWYYDGDVPFPTPAGCP